VSGPCGSRAWSSGQPRQLREWGQVTLAYDGGDRRAVDGLAEQRVHERRLVAGQRLGGRRGEAEDDGVRQLVEHLGQQPSPHLQQVVALVQHQRQRAGRPHRLDEREAVGVQPGQQRLLGTLLVDLAVWIKGRQRLVGQRVDEAGQVAAVPGPGWMVGRRQELGPAREPL